MGVLNTWSDRVIIGELGRPESLAGETCLDEWWFGEGWSREIVCSVELWSGDEGLSVRWFGDLVLRESWARELR